MIHFRNSHETNWTWITSCSGEVCCQNCDVIDIILRRRVESDFTMKSGVIEEIKLEILYKVSRWIAGRTRRNEIRIIMFDREWPERSVPTSQIRITVDYFGLIIFIIMVRRQNSTSAEKRLPDSSVSSLIRAGWRQEGHPVTKNSCQHSQGWTTALWWQNANSWLSTLLLGSSRPYPWLILRESRRLVDDHIKHLCWG